MSTRGYSPENHYLSAEKLAGREDGALFQLLKALQALTNKLHSDGALAVLAQLANDPRVTELAGLAVSLREKMLSLLLHPRRASSVSSIQ